MFSCRDCKNNNNKSEFCSQTSSWSFLPHDSGSVHLNYSHICNSEIKTVKRVFALSFSHSDFLYLFSFMNRADVWSTLTPTSEQRFSHFKTTRKIHSRSGRLRILSNQKTNLCINQLLRKRSRGFRLVAWILMTHISILTKTTYLESIYWPAVISWHFAQQVVPISSSPPYFCRYVLQSRKTGPKVRRS